MSNKENEHRAIHKNFLMLHAREKQGLSLEKLAKKISRDTAWVIDVEEGRVTLSFNEAELLGKVLLVSPHHIYMYSLQLSKLHTGIHLEKQRNENTL